MYVKIAEAPCEPALLLGSDRLLAKEQDLVLHQQFVETIDRLLRQLIGERDAIDDGA
jgi:hypothetical protein